MITNTVASEKASEELKIETILFSIALLLGGN